MQNGKAIRVDDIPIKVLKCLGKQGIKQLMKLFNLIFKTKKMFDQQRVSTLIPLIPDIKTKKMYKILRIIGALSNRSYHEALRKSHREQIKEGNQCDRKFGFRYRQ